MIQNFRFGTKTHSEVSFLRDMNFQCSEITLRSLSLSESDQPAQAQGLEITGHLTH